jgi:uncharacterized protein (TIGR02246 family)
MQKTVFICVSLLLCVTTGVSLAQAVTPENEIAALRTEWACALHEKQLELSLALYTEDASFMSPDAPRITGKEALRGLYRQVFAQITSDITLESKQTGYSGLLAYDSGDYHETLTPVQAGPAQTISGSYLMVLRREPDGKWRIVQQVWTQLQTAGAKTAATGH